MSESTELDVLVKQAVSRLESGALSIEDLLKALTTEPPAPAKVPEPPLPAAITPKQREALERAVEVYGSVVPDKRRELGHDEIDKLIEEKAVLDEIKKMAESRIKDGIRQAIFNHLDVEAERQGIVADAQVDKDGHYLVAGEARGDESGTVFKRVISEYSPTVDIALLESLVDDPEVEFTRKDFLAMTRQTRVVDEHDLMVALKKNPQLINAIVRAIRPGSKVASLRVGKP